MLKRNFNFYADAGHGWLEVTPTDLERVGMKVSEFSNFSYKDEMQKSCMGQKCWVRDLAHINW